MLSRGMLHSLACNNTMASLETNFSAALATWKGTDVTRHLNSTAHTSPWLDINLSELQKTLDVQGVELVDSQKESLVGRKALAEKTKG